MTQPTAESIGWELYRSYLGVLSEGSLSGAARALASAALLPWAIPSRRLA